MMIAISNSIRHFLALNPSEATTVDPQQRKFLEVVYETFESAGVTLEKLSGSRTACYAGCFTSDYKTMQNKDVDCGVPHQMTVSKLGTRLEYWSTSLIADLWSDLTIVSNRINYVFNLKGPSYESLGIYYSPRNC